MRICLIATEYPGFGAYGGFGVLTRDIATGLAARGVDVCVAMPQKKGQLPIERSDNIPIFSYPSQPYVGISSVIPHKEVYERIGADVYHSEEPSLGTALAQIACPGRKHLVTFQDPRNFFDWIVEWAHHSQNMGRLRRFRWKLWVFKWYLRYQRETGEAARRAGAKFCQAKFIIPKVRKMYRLAESPKFLPNPIRMLNVPAGKPNVPTVCYLGRWDERKRPELFLELAARFPNVKFIIAGACLNSEERDKKLRNRSLRLKNVEAPGWLAAGDRAAILDRAWILINTSSRECLPVTYLEAGAHGCAILSHCDADNFASNFGFWARKGNLHDFEHGLKLLLKDNLWKTLGQKAYNYVRETHEYNRVIDQHIGTYEGILNKSLCLTH